MIGTGRFEIALCVAVVFESEEVLLREAAALGRTPGEIAAVLGYLCSVAFLHEVHFLWRPQLRDADDDMVLELAVNAACSAIVTYHERDFRGVERFGLTALTPRSFLERNGALP